MHAANCKVKPKENLFLMKSVCRLSKTHSGNNLKSIFRVAYEAKWLYRRRGIVYIIVNLKKTISLKKQAAAQLYQSFLTVCHQSIYLLI